MMAAAANAAVRGARAPEKLPKQLKIANLVSFVAAEVYGVVIAFGYGISFGSIVSGITFMILALGLFVAEFSFAWIDKYFGFLIPRLGRGLFHVYIGWSILGPPFFLPWLLGLIVLIVGLGNIVLWKMYRYDERINGRPTTSLNVDALKKGRVEEVPTDGSAAATASAGTPVAAATAPAPAATMGGDQSVANSRANLAGHEQSAPYSDPSAYSINPYSDEHHQQPAPAYSEKDTSEYSYQPEYHGDHEGQPRSDSLATNDTMVINTENQRAQANQAQRDREDEVDYVDVDLKL